MPGLCGSQPVIWLMVVAGLSAVVTPSEAITFNLVYKGPGSASPDPRAVTFAGDPNGTLLASQMQQAAADWSSVIGDTHTMTINYFYAGADQVPTETANARTLNAISVGTPQPNRTTLGEIKFIAGQVGGFADWWFDPSPQADTEFNFQQTLLQDLAPSQQTAEFVQGIVGAPLLEVGFRGTAPGASAAFNKADVLSAARHEIGHLMGVTNFANLLAAGEETLDGDYDFDPSLVGGASVAARVQTNIEPGELDSHLESQAPLMSGYGSALGTRRAITATDVFAAASVGNWLQINLHRVDYMGLNTNFHSGSNWEGGRAPDPLDSVAIRHGGNVQMAANDVVNSFLLADASTLSTGPNSLTTQGLTTIGPTSGVGASRLTVGSGGGFFTRELVIVEDTVAVAGGQLNVAQGDITNGGRLQGNGFVRFDGRFRNNGVIEADGGTLVIEEAIPGSGGRIDLDGQFPSTPGTLRAVTGSLDINTALDGATGGSPALYSGEITIGAGRFLEVVNDLRLQNGVMVLDGSATQAATFRGPKLIVNSDLIADRLAVVDAEVELVSGADVQLPQANDSLAFQQTVSLLGGHINGSGHVNFEDNLIAGFGSIDLGKIDLKGSTTISQATIAATEIDASGQEVFLNGGSLDFELFTGKLGQSGGVIGTGKSKLDGAFSQSGGTIAFDIRGPGDHDWLDVTDRVSLDGVINVALAGGYNPSGGEQFQVLTTSGGLDIDSLSLAGPDANRFQLLVDSNSVVLIAVALLTGDYNGDGMVDAADYTLWRDGDLAADGDGDGAVDADDYALWAVNYGSSTSSTTTAVPEPATLTMALLGLTVGRRRAYEVSRRA